jgi:hypothetical protein
MYNEIRRGYLPVLRAIKRTCQHDIDAERQIIGAIRISIAEMINACVPTNDILTELDMTRQMILQNIAQVSFNDSIDSYSVKIREEMLPKDGVTLDIKTPADLLKEQQCNVDDFVSNHSSKQE